MNPMVTFLIAVLSDLWVELEDWIHELIEIMNFFGIDMEGIFQWA